MLKYIIKNKRKIIGIPEMLDKLLKVKGLDNPKITVYSSWRSLKEQQALYDAGKSQTLTSNHRRGVACDIIGWDMVQKEMQDNGMINDISWDKNHFALGGEYKATKYPLIDKLPTKLEEYKPIVKTPDNSESTAPLEMINSSSPQEPTIVSESTSNTQVPVSPEVNASTLGMPKNEVPVMTYQATGSVDTFSSEVKQELITNNMIKDFLLSKTAKRFYWTTAGGFVGLAIVYISGINFLYAPLVIAILTGISKEINNKINTI